MTVSRLSGERILIVLDSSDMFRLSLDFERMSMEDAHSKRVLLGLISSACRSAGLSAGGRTARVEALKMSEGCYLLLTFKEKQSFKLSKSDSVCYRMGNCSELLDAVEALYRSGMYCRKSSVYELSGEYYLIFGYPAIPKGCSALLGEFEARRCGKLTCARVREAGREICAQNAVEIIGKHF